MNLQRPPAPVLALAALLFAVLALLPFASVHYPPINDYPFHLARIAILSKLDSFSQFYRLGSFLLPNVGLDAVAVPLAAIFGAEHAVRIFVEGVLLLTLAGLILLSRAAHGRWSAWPLLGVGLLYNGIFRFGFFNYLFGLALALLATALWLRLRGTVAGFAAVLASCVILIFCHMEAFGVFALAVAGIELDRAVTDFRRTRTLAPLGTLILSGAPFVLTLVGFVLLSPTAGASSSWRYTPGWGTKPFGQLFSLSAGQLPLDAAVVVTLLGLCIWLFARGWLAVSRPLAVSAGLILLAAIILPPALMGSLYADDRLGPAVAMFALAALGLTASAPARAQRVVFGAAFALAALQAAILCPAWAVYDRQIGTIAASLDKVPSGATLFTYTNIDYPRLITDTPERRKSWRPPIKHVGSYAALHAPIFVPMTFADPTKQPMVVAAPWAPVKTFQDDNPIKFTDSRSLAAVLAELHGKLADPSWPRIAAPFALVTGTVELSPMPAWAVPVVKGDGFLLLRLEVLPRDRG